MKPLLALLIISSLVGSSWGHAQENSWNLRTSPLGLVGGEANLRLDYALAERWTLGPEAGLINRDINGVDERAGAIGLFTAYHFNGAFTDGPYIDFGVAYLREHAKDKATGNSAEFTSTSLRALGGYHWFWKVINLSLGGGLATNTAGKVIIRDTHGQEVDHIDIRPIRLALDFSLGVTF